MRINRIPSIGAAVAVMLLLVGCADASADAECERIYEETISPVEGVASLEVDCSSQFGGGWKRVSVHVATNDEDEMWEVSEDVERALAENPEIASDWRTPASYYLEDGTEFRGGSNKIEGLREQLGIEP